MPRVKRKREDEGDEENPPTKRSKRERWKALDQASISEENQGNIINHIKSIFANIPNKKKYSTEGEQSATTTVTYNSETAIFRTETQMHSEMRAVKWLVETKNANYNNLENISLDDFQTNLIHCGFCTFYLSVLGMPLGRPSKGRFNQANNCLYPLPDQLKRDIDFVEKVTGMDQNEIIAMISEGFASNGFNPSWNQFIAKTDYFNKFWMEINKCLYDVTESPK